MKKVRAGAVSMRLIDYILPHVHLFGEASDAEGIKTSWRQTTLLVLAITLHNIPEGLAIGVAFGAVASGHAGATLGAAKGVVADDAPLQQNLNQTLLELQRSARSLRTLTDLLGREPEALIRGRAKVGPATPSSNPIPTTPEPSR